MAVHVHKKIGPAKGGNNSRTGSQKTMAPQPATPPPPHGVVVFGALAQHMCKCARLE